MYLCPVCGKEIENTICSACGFDKSCDFENYPTLSEVSSQALGISNLKETYENKQKKYISCKNCGGRTFYIDIESGGILCSECLNPIDGRYESKSHPHNSEEATTKQYTVEQAVQERKKFLILRNLMTRDLSCHDSTKYRCHNCISYLIKVISP